MRRTFLALAAVALLGLPSVPSSAAELPPATVRSSTQEAASGRVITWRQYSYRNEVVWVVGEIQNTGAEALAQPLILARFDDWAGQVVTAAAYADAPILLPGLTTTFRVTVPNPPEGLRLAAIELDGQPTAQLPSSNLIVTDQRGAVEEYETDRIYTIPGCDSDKRDCTGTERVLIKTENYIVEGTVRNLGREAVRNVVVSIALYNQSGEIVNVGAVPVERLGPGESSGYRLVIYWAPGTARATVRAFGQ